MPVRAVCKPHSPDLKRGALATDARGCSLWRSLLERRPPALESRVRPFGELVRPVSGGGVTLTISFLCRLHVSVNLFSAGAREGVLCRGCCVCVGGGGGGVVNVCI